MPDFKLLKLKYFIDFRFELLQIAKSKKVKDCKMRVTWKLLI
tara:strand:+ start:191 stop:316 length:126 start_codon:yes stop_codon:yes gene_type:complete